MTLFIAWGQQVTQKNKPQPPGNSLPIIDMAYELGYDGVEIDLQLSKDGVLVLMHNSTIDKTTFGCGKVSDFTLEELRGIRIRDEWNGSPCFIPSFEDALRLNGNRGPVMCDLRGANPRAIAALHSAVDGAGFDPSRLLLLAYNRRAGLLLKQEFPRSLVMLKAPVTLKPPALTVDFINEADGLESILVPCAHFPDLTAEFKAEAEKRGMKVGVYLHHRSLSSLMEILEKKIDFITTIGHQFFQEARRAYPRRDLVPAF